MIRAVLKWSAVEATAAVTVLTIWLLPAVVGSMAASSSDDLHSPVVSDAIVVRMELLVEVDEYPVRREYLGSVQVRRRSKLGFEFGGLLAEIAAEEGDVVETGQVLAKLDTARLHAQRRELEARRDRARAELDLAEITAVRQQSLLDFAVVSEQERDNARKRADGLKALLAEAEASIAALDVELERSTIKAPFAGAITRQRTDEGSVIAAGEPLLEIVELSNPEARFALPVRALQHFLPGTIHPLTSAFGDVEAIVRAQIPLTHQSTRTVDVVMEIQGLERTIPDGSVIRLSRVERIPGRCFPVPLEALSEGARGMWSVYTVTEDRSGGDVVYTSERRQVQVLHVDGETAYVNGQLSSGERLIVTGLHKVVPATRVSDLAGLAP